MIRTVYRTMSQRAFGYSLDAISRKWCVFAERRRDYYFELQASGRWRRYYSEAAFAAQMREVTRDVEIWSGLSGLPESPQAVSTPQRIEAHQTGARQTDFLQAAE